MEFNGKYLQFLKHHRMSFILKFVVLPIIIILFYNICKLVESVLDNDFGFIIQRIGGWVLVLGLFLVLFLFIGDICTKGNRVRLYTPLSLYNDWFYYREMVNSVLDGDEDGFDEEYYLTYTIHGPYTYYISDKSVLVIGDIKMKNGRKKTSGNLSYAKFNNYFDFPNHFQRVSEDYINQIILSLPN